MRMPFMRINAEKFQKLHDHWKGKAIKEHKETKQNMFQAENKGQWNLCKELGEKRASPLVAVKRLKKSEKGHAQGTVATDPDEVDEIFGEGYGKIYDGNAHDEKRPPQNIWRIMRSTFFAEKMRR